MFRSLRSRFTAGVVAVIAAAVLALGFGVSSLFGQVLQDQYLTTYNSNASAVYYILYSSLDGGLLLQPSLVEGHLGPNVKSLSQQFHFRIRIYTADTSDPIVDSGPSVANKSTHLAVERFPTRRNLPLQYQGITLGSVVISDPLTDRGYRQSQFDQNLIWIGVGACLAAFVVGGILSERLTAPVRILTRAAGRMGEGHLSERVPEDRRDEAGELARQFNRMAERLEDSFTTITADRDHLRQFVGDVSHELRTPLTALRTFNDLLQDGAGRDPDTRQDFLAESARQIERLDWLTHNLLDLSRLDSGISPVTPRLADLSQTVQRAVEANRPPADAREVTLDLDAHPIFAPHDPPRLEQALSNVVGNAIKFSPRGSAVRIRVYARGEQAVAEVSDEGPGIPPEEAPHVFERFYRGRDANRSGEGSGLGLAIAKSIVEAHHGTITVESCLPHGTTMRLSLPAGATTHESSQRANIPRA